MFCKLNKINMLSEKIDIKRVYDSKISNSSIDIMSRLSGDSYHSFKSQLQYQNLHSVSLLAYPLFEHDIEQGAMHKPLLIKPETE